MNEELPFIPANLGGLARHDDARDYILGEASAATCPATFMQAGAFAAPLYYQGHRPACGAHAGVWLKTFLDIRAGNTAAYYTPRFTWADIKRDGTNPSDGTDMRSIFRSLAKTGTDTFEPLENNVTYGDADYASNRFITSAMRTQAAAHTLSAYAFFTPTFQQIKQNIYDHGAALLLIRIGDEFWTAPNGVSSWAEKDILPLRHPKTVVSAHFIVAHSYDENYVYFANSFGATWGRKGHGYFGPGYMPWIVEAGTGPEITAPNLVIPTVSQQVTEAVKQIQTLPPALEVSWLQRLINILLGKGG